MREAYAGPEMFLRRTTSAPHGPDCPPGPLHNGAPRALALLPAYQRDGEKS